MTKECGMHGTKDLKLANGRFVGVVDSSINYIQML